MEKSSINRARAAAASIRGYAYQFDKTTLAILSLDGTGEVVVEGLEDVDVLGSGGAQAIQCKYHAGSKFSLPAIRKPLLAMLKGYAAGKTWDFHLYAHFSDPENIPLVLTVDQLKQSLTETKRDGSVVEHHAPYNTQALQGFVDHLTIEPAPEFAAQQEQVRDALADALSASKQDIADLHYGNSIALVMHVAMLADQNDRKLTRQAFLDELNRRPAMFTRWHREFLEHERYLKSVKKRIQNLGLTKSTGMRIVMIGRDEIATATTATSLADLIEHLWPVGYGPGHLHTARPWTVVLDADADAVADIKCELIGKGMIFNDGYEHLQFSPDAFDRAALVNRAVNKVTKVAYDVRVLSRVTFETHSASLQAPTVLLAFDEQPPQPDFTEPPRRLDVAGAGLEEIGQLLGAFT